MYTRLRQLGVRYCWPHSVLSGGPELLFLLRPLLEERGGYSCSNPEKQSSLFEPLGLQLCVEVDLHAASLCHCWPVCVNLLSLSRGSQMFFRASPLNRQNKITIQSPSPTSRWVEIIHFQVINLALSLTRIMQPDQQVIQWKVILMFCFVSELWLNQRETWCQPLVRWRLCTNELV